MVIAYEIPSVNAGRSPVLFGDWRVEPCREEDVVKIHAAVMKGQFPVTMPSQ
jgi:hypothetical protein